MRTIQEMIQQEVIQNASEFVGQMQYIQESLSPEYHEDLMSLWLSVDYETTVENSEYEIVRVDVEQNDPYFVYVDSDDLCDEGVIYAVEETPGLKQHSYLDACIECYEDNHLEEVYKEPLQYWIVTDYFGRELRELGEVVVFDFMGFTIWGRTCCGQAIYMDGVIQDLYEKTHQRYEAALAD